MQTKVYSEEASDIITFRTEAHASMIGFHDEKPFPWLSYMPYLTLWDKISQNSAYLKANSQKNFQISQNF